MKNILDHKLIVLKESCIIKENLKEALSNIGHTFADLNIISKMETTEAIKTLVQKGYGTALVPYNSVKDEFEANELKISRIEDYNLDYNIYMIRKSTEKLTDDLKEFIQGFKSLGPNICC